MKIIIEKNIPYIEGRLEAYATVQYLPNDEITTQTVADVDALIVRTRTRCNSGLLAGSRCQFIGTATIGTDHIDLPYCREHGIRVHNAPGCNAPAVAQYVISGIGHWMAHKDITVSSALTLGIVGVGHVGSIIARWAKEIGFRVLLNDPPRQLAEGSREYVGLERIAEEADIITFHTPMVKTGDFPTYHLADSRFLCSLRRCRLLINSARGAVVDNQALLRAMNDSQGNLDAIIDCWEHEPQISDELLKRAFIATPHIAGYSAEGKTRATAMVLEALAKDFHFDIEIPSVETPLRGAVNVTMRKVMESYNPHADTQSLRENPEMFERLRNTYNLRHEVE